MGNLRDDLAAQADRMIETHISWVFLVGDDVFKVKKPVDLGFLDFTTLDRRRAACEAEVELDRRLADDVYLGVVDITLEGDRHRIGGEGEAVDVAVHMRRLPERERADRRLEAGALGVAEVDRIATRVARFHATQCPTDARIAAFGHPDAIRVNVRENFAQLQTEGPQMEGVLTEAEAAEIERWQLAFLDERGSLFERRIAAGRVRDGHGDLRLEHVYLGEDRIRIIDGIEFNERFRFADVCADLAFLSMDLAYHGRVDLAERVLATYARESNDFDLYPMVDFYEAYRATVRGKIASFLLADPQAPAEDRARAREEARRYLLLALAAEGRPLLPPTLVAVGGLIASGKSTLADHLGAAMGAPTLNTDRVRKDMIGAAPTDRLYEGSWSGAYDPAFTEQVYAEVERRAEVVLRSGRPVILDASFRSKAMRASALALAERIGVPFRFVECRVDPEVCRARLAERDMTTSVSDGRPEIFDAFLAKWEPIDELPEEVHLPVDNTLPLDEVIASLRGALPMWPAGRAAAPRGG